MKRFSREHAQQLHVANQTRKEMRAADPAYAMSDGTTRWQTGAHVDTGSIFTRGLPATPFARICRAAGLPEPVAEYRFHDQRKWRFDYAWPTRMVALEVEGGIWRTGGGAHSHPMNIERDCEKYSEAAIAGWRILRVPPEKLLTTGLEYVRRAVG